MSDFATRPRQTPMAGRRKATSTWCEACQRLHRTHRHALGVESCAAVEAERADRRESLFAFPHIRPTKVERPRINLGADGTPRRIG